MGPPGKTSHADWKTGGAADGVRFLVSRRQFFRTVVISSEVILNKSRCSVIGGTFDAQRVLFPFQNLSFSNWFRSGLSDGIFHFPKCTVGNRFFEGGNAHDVFARQCRAARKIFRREHNRGDRLFRVIMVRALMQAEVQHEANRNYDCY